MKVVKYICIILFININLMYTMRFIPKTFNKVKKVKQKPLPIPTIERLNRMGVDTTLFVRDLDKKVEESALDNITKMPVEFRTLTNIANRFPSGPIIPLSSKFKRNCLAFYSSYLNTVTTTEFFDSLPRSVQYMVLLHEYRHHLQNKNELEADLLYGLDGSFKYEEFIKIYRNFFSKEVMKKIQKHSLEKRYMLLKKIVLESDADYFAISNISCPTCLKICHVVTTIREKKYNRSSRGYFHHDEIKPFIELAEQENICCAAHSVTPGDEYHNSILQQLEQLLLEFNRTESEDLLSVITDLDNQSGILLQRIPHYYRDIIKSMSEYKEYEKRLAQKTFKELDQKYLNEKIGTLKLLAAPKQLFVPEVLEKSIPKVKIKEIMFA